MTVAAYVCPVGTLKKDTAIDRIDKMIKKLYMRLSFHNGTLRISLSRSW